MTDIHKEEQDTLEANGLTMKDISKDASHKAKNWYFGLGQVGYQK